MKNEEIQKIITLTERVNTLYNRDKRIIQARKKFEDKIEKRNKKSPAWTEFNMVQNAVRKEIEDTLKKEEL